MQLQSNKLYYSLILFITGLRVILTNPKACPAFFDCNSYLAMMQSIAYEPSIAGHHAMRILPVLLANGLSQLGLSDELSFRVLSGACYIAFGLLTFWFFRQCMLKPLIAFGFSLLCLAAHHAICIPLVLVYQTCDMMTYPLIVLMFYCSLYPQQMNLQVGADLLGNRSVCKIHEDCEVGSGNNPEGSSAKDIQRQSTVLFVVALLSILVRQNLLILGECSLLYCYWQSKQRRILVYAGLLATAYSALQSYYHATSTFTALLQPPEDFFTLSHLWFVVLDSNLLQLFVPLLPFMLLYAKSIMLLLVRYWHLTLYMAITVGQPFLGYHMTGNNFARIALQGVIGLYILAGMASTQYRWSKTQIVLFLGYALSIYITWGIVSRLMIMAVFSIIFGWLSFKQRLCSFEVPILSKSV